MTCYYASLCIDLNIYFFISDLEITFAVFRIKYNSKTRQTDVSFKKLLVSPPITVIQV